MQLSASQFERVYLESEDELNILSFKCFVLSKTSQGRGILPIYRIISSQLESGIKNVKSKTAVNHPKVGSLPSHTFNSSVVITSEVCFLVKYVFQCGLIAKEAVIMVAELVS